ncbi:MAG: Coenzyme F420 hydrogenase/dehydrogenase, beta subunit C-terminal domain [Anaerolineae bacterium]
MSALPQPVQETIAEWLRTGEIEVFLGYEPGTLPLRATPAFIRRPEDVGRLIWDATCENNLAAFLPKFRGKKVGIMAKGCDARALVGLMQEGQLKRENVRIVGVSCPGMVDPKKVAQRLGISVEDLEEAALGDGEVVAQGQRMVLAELFFDTCVACHQHNPNVSDVLLGETLPNEPEDDPYALVHEMEALSSEERWARFAGEVNKCNLCYACRNACPMCFCNKCFADCTTPRWFNQTSEPADKQFYQIIRTFHLAGRCVGCGACTRACPQGVNIRLFLDKTRSDVAELFAYTAGDDPNARPPLTTYREDDYNDFIMG